MAKVYVIGSLNVDMVMQMDKLPERGETLAGTGFFVNCGGKGANQAVACAKAGAKTYMVGCIGDDAFGELQLRSLSEAGADVRFVRKTERPTGTASIWVCGGDNRIVLDAGANALVSRGDVDCALATAEAGDCLVVQFEIPEETVLYALGRAKELGLHTVVNPAPARRCPDALLALTDELIPNETERDILTEGTRDLTAFGVGRLIVTLGEKGAEIVEQDTHTAVPAFPVKAVDTTAAGDTFIGYYVAGLLAGLEADRAVRRACGASALAVGRSGAQSSIPTAAEVDAFLKGKNIK